ncbi:thioredoxin [archaeon CG10_big_fil_rev_8_21_14_0_10_43_11]|nr:MAG: thioredoxin [archaeon CG10_big_fil_rev_8_21_14_0_10_43_11]
MSIIHVTKDNFNDEVLKSSVPVIADFWADWCAPCRMLAPVFEDLSAKMKNVKFVKINVDKEPTLGQMFGVMSIPTILVFKKGAEAKRFMGFMPQAMLQKKIEDAIA